MPDPCSAEQRHIRSLTNEKSHWFGHQPTGDPNLSKSLIDPVTSNPGAGDWYLLIDGVDIGIVTDADSRLERDLRSAEVRIDSTGVYRLLWDLTKADLARCRTTNRTS